MCTGPPLCSAKWTDKGGKIHILALQQNAKKKLFEKSCDWILANNVGADTNTFGGGKNKVQLINKTKTESWPEMSKVDVGNRLAIKVAEHLDDLKP